jgi:hypothetical protein
VPASDAGPAVAGACTLTKLDAYCCKQSSRRRDYGYGGYQANDYGAEWACWEPPEHPAEGDSGSAAAARAN